MKKINKNKSWYSVIVALLLIWFIMLLSIGIFKLILNEMKNNRMLWDYIKSYAWAESAQELALLDIKKKWYWYYNKIQNDVNDKSILLSENPLDESIYHPKKDTLISYDNDWKVNTYNWSLSPLWYDIIPLFYIDEVGERKVNDISFTVITWDSSSLSWNVISKDSGVSWIWELNLWTEKKFDSLTNRFQINENRSVNDFLLGNTTNYLVLFNSWNSDDITYKISSTEFFTKPRLDIISSWEVWNYKQNLKTRLDNTEFLNILRYSIYSN